MNKNVVIILLAVLAVAALVYAQNQKAKADFCERIGKQKDGTIYAQTKAIENLRKVASDNMNDAIQEHRRAEEAIAKCK